MSKQLKNLIASDVSSRLSGVNDALLVNVIGLNSANTYSLRKELRSKNIRLLVVKSSLALRATEGQPIAKAFEGGEGSLAIVWGSDDFVSLCKEMVEIHKKPEFEKCVPKGGVMDGERLSPEKVEEVSKWPNRTQQISMLVGQILSPGAKLLSQLNSPGGKLLSQIKKKSEGEEGAADAAPEASA
ncbi:ribosomal protein L10 [Pirellula staleyi DSM 6068]|uniref:Large ribosomal subunit protein uL10 n=1 Tax=Pirellula staleyi (strain ATCC 27377 / DSM 6068 / ICPB 4128) TaxID=530564 RepID=D2R5P1_PIRSD|nr:50S ribosomal protein L10 [Pirellula staleyi]ADB17223.1 ribosomal protein L10 [Pirellula staleyi DSM 6068]